MKSRFLLFVLMCVLVDSAMSQTMQPSSSLSKREEAIVLISSFTAIANMEALSIELNNGLDHGLSVEETKEIMIQLYAYCGFPRSLNALHKFMEVLELRRKRGINDSHGARTNLRELNRSLLEIGSENQTKLVGSKVEGGVYNFAPTIDLFLKEHLFGAIFNREIFDWRTREIITISALAAMEGTENQLRSHYNVGLYNGLTMQHLTELSDLIGNRIGENRGRIAKEVLKSIVEKKAYKTGLESYNGVFHLGEKVGNTNFVGTVWLNQLIQSDTANSIQVGNVTFEPGSRTKWHYHPEGQILLVLDGFGYYQELGSPKRLLKKGDVVRCPSNKHHWHGATPTDKFVQTAITDTKGGSTVWLQAVSDEEYHKPLH